MCVFVSRMGSSRCLVRAMCGWVAIEAAMVVVCWQSVAVDVCVVHRFGQTLIAAAVPIIYLCLRSAMRLVRDGDASFALLHVVHTSYGHTNFWVKGCSGAQLWGQLPDPGPQLLGQPPRGGQHAHHVSRAPWQPCQEPRRKTAMTAPSPASAWL